MEVNLQGHRHVSIHAPAGGATPALIFSRRLILFQSTRLREARHMQNPLLARLSWFQSTRLREARHKTSHEVIGLDMFQSTRLREARQSHDDYR